MQGRVVGVRVFLEGIEIDVASVGVQGMMGQGAVANIEIPSADAVHKILPRTLVHVFYHENDHRLEDPTNRGSAIAADPANDRFKENWRLLFAGEVTKYGYSNAGGSRQASLTCQDFSSYWNAAKLYWGSNNTSLHSYKSAIAAGAAQTYTGKTEVARTNALLELLLARPATNPKLTGVLGGVVSLMEAATGVFHPGAKKQFRGVNDFMSQAELRLHLTHILGASPADNTSAKYLSAGQFRQYLRRMASSVGSTAAFSDLLALMLGRIQYNWTSVPAPPFFHENRGDRLKSKVVVSRKAQAIADPVIRGHNAEIAKLYKFVQEHYAKSQTRLGGPRQTDPTKTVDNGGDPLYMLSYKSGLHPVSSIDHDGHKAFATNGVVTGFPDANTWRARASAVRSKLPNAAAKDKFTSKISRGYDWAASASDLLRIIAKSSGGLKYANHTTQNFQTLRQLLEDASAALGGGLGGTTAVVDADVAVGSRLNMHMFIPDLFMAPPPTCNVLFPDHYHSIQFSRNWLTETTRVLLHTKTASGRDVKNIYFSPNTDILSGPSDTSVQEAVKKGASFLMPHELYTGPIIAIEGVGDTSIFRAIHKEVVKDNKKANPTATEEDVAGDAAYSPQTHLQRAANHMFFLRRFEGRSMVVQTRFCPQLVVGFPVLVLDPLLAGRDLKDGDVPKGTHFIGTAAAIIHHIDARGSASTTVHLIKCREHREAADLFPKGTRTKKVARAPGSKRIIGYQKFSLDPASGDLGNRNTNGEWRPDLTRPVYVNGKPIKLKPTDDLAATGHTSSKSVDRRAATAGSATLVGRDEVDGDVSREGTFSSDSVIRSRVVHVEVELFRDVARAPQEKEVSFNFEQSATPPWFATCFLPHNIGKQFYREMLGCGSVLDDSPLLARVDSEAERVRAEDEARVNAEWEAKKARAEAAGEPMPVRDNVAVPKDVATLVIRNRDGSTRTSDIPGLLLLPARSTQQAADQLAGSWKLLSEQGADLSMFMDSYVSRSYATLTDIMGDMNTDLTYRAGHELFSKSSQSREPGFHGNAYGNLTGLLDYAGEKLQYAPLASLGTTIDGLREVPGKVDPRAERRQRVVDYVNELKQHK